MVNLHSYYITNTQTELKHINEIQDEQQIDNLIHQMKYIEFEEENDEFDDDDNEIDETEEEVDSNNTGLINLIDYNNYFNFSDEEFHKVMEMNIEVVIEQEPEIIHGDLNFDNDE